MMAIFLDRDGVVNRKVPEGQYIRTWRELLFLPDTFGSVARFSRAGFKIFIITNQRGVALGKVRLEDLEDIHLRIRARFAEHGAVLTDIYFCPHDISDDCICRKPKPGMLLQAAKEHRLDLPACWMIGDAESDIAAGKNTGCKTVKIIPAESVTDTASQADMQARDLSSAARKILRLVRGPIEILSV
jgi:D-glycero-D-manno-heptose 1,7-bisphosphate phosphatase